MISNLINNNKKIINYRDSLKISSFSTPLGPLIAIANQKALYLLEFIERNNLKKEIEQLTIKTRSQLIEGTNQPIELIQRELKEYFHGTLHQFKTPIHLFGTPFQKHVWQTLQNIPFGQTWSYVQLAQETGNPSAFRAVANANGKNQLAIIIPCHRVINKNGKLGGYGGGLSNKQWLLDHEANFKF